MSERSPPILRLLVSALDEGKRADAFVSRALNWSRRDVRELFERGAVTLQRPGRASYVLRQRAFLLPIDSELWVAPGELSSARPDPLTELQILLETPELIVANKPAGLPSAATRSSSSSSAASVLLSRYPELADVGHNRYEPGLLHRLDTFTSGVLVAARNVACFDRLRSLWATNVDKRYLALISMPNHTELSPGAHVTFTSDLEPDPGSPKRVRSCPGHRFQTRATLLGRSGPRALFDVSVGSAYRHQIRVHFADHGWPLVGDVLYGSEETAQAPRHALHAYYVACNAPPEFRVTAALPEDFELTLGPELTLSAAEILDRSRSSKSAS